MNHITPIHQTIQEAASYASAVLVALHYNSDRVSLRQEFERLRESRKECRRLKNPDLPTFYRVTTNYLIRFRRGTWIPEF